jgi:hypothetical protein
MPVVRHLTATFVLVCVWLTAASAGGQTRVTIRLSLNGKTIEGMPLKWSERSVALLARDGRLWEFHPAEAKEFHKAFDGFRPYSTARMRAALLEEFGQGFQVSGAGHYLVVHPSGSRDPWATRFDELYRSYIQYFTARGFRPRAPQFPMVAVVFPNHLQFAAYSRKVGAPTGRGVLGYYSRESNRIVMYDTGGGQENAVAWQMNADTIVHEATHQLAYNTGVHRRMASTPLWVAEGLATLFEAPGVWDSRSHPTRVDRVNQGRLAAYRRHADTRSAQTLEGLISSNAPFKQNAAAAYAESWALTFYLSETRPKQFFQYLAKTARRPEATPYDADERAKDFTDVFGRDWRMLHANLTRFVDKQP